jgi:emfourin
MKISLAQHGGQAAALRLNSPPQTIDSAALDPSQAAELKGLVTAAASSPLATRFGKARDEMSYTITIHDDGRETVLSQSDTAMSADFGNLLTWLRRHPKT